MTRTSATTPVASFGAAFVAALYLACQASPAAPTRVSDTPSVESKDAATEVLPSDVGDIKLSYSPTLTTSWEWFADSADMRIQEEMAMDGDHLYVATATLDATAPWQWRAPHGLNALDISTGVRRWVQPAEGPLIRSVVADVGRHEVLVAANLVFPPHGGVRRYSDEGDLVSRFVIPTTNPGSPGVDDSRLVVSELALAQDSSVYFIAGSALLAVDWSGTQLWATPLRDSRGSGASVAVTGNRVIAYAAGQARFHDRSTGSLIAVRTVGSARPCTLRVASSGEVFVAQDSVRVFDADGGELWKRTFDLEVCPIEGGHGKLMYFSPGGAGFGESTMGWFDFASEGAAVVGNFVSPSKQLVALDDGGLVAWYWPEADTTEYGGIHEFVVLDSSGALVRRERLPVPRRSDVAPILTDSLMIYGTKGSVVAARVALGPVASAHWFTASGDFANTRSARPSSGTSR